MSSVTAPFKGVEHLLEPRPKDLSDAFHISKTVSNVLSAVREYGDKAVAEFSLKFDKSDLKTFEVTHEDREVALEELDLQTRKDTKFAAAQPKTMLPLEIEICKGIHLGHRIIPIEK